MNAALNLLTSSFPGVSVIVQPFQVHLKMFFNYMAFQGFQVVAYEVITIVTSTYLHSSLLFSSVCLSELALSSLVAAQHQRQLVQAVVS